VKKYKDGEKDTALCQVGTNRLKKELLDIFCGGFMRRTVENCSVIKKYQAQGQKKPPQKVGKCQGYNNEYYWPDGRYAACDRCKLNDNSV